MTNAISTHWLPINSKEAYRFYLEADRIANSAKKLSLKRRITNALGLTSLCWRYTRLLRKAEYYHNCKSSFIYKPYNAYLAFKLHRSELKLGFHIPLNVFGPGLFIYHYGTILVNPKTRVGANCSLQNLVGIAGKSAVDGRSPTIGDNMFIGQGAFIVGDISIADGIVIGAHSVVTASFLEPNITIAGSPARKISETGVDSFFDENWAGHAVKHYLAEHKDKFAKY
jgi:serine O-acetyltransferase